MHFRVDLMAYEYSVDLVYSMKRKVPPIQGCRVLSTDFKYLTKTSNPIQSKPDSTRKG